MINNEELFEDAAFQALFVEKKSIADARRSLEEQGIKCSKEKLRRFKRLIFKIASSQHRREIMADKLLESIDKIIEEFEYLANETKDLIQRFDDEGKLYSKLVALREYREQLALAMKRLGELKSGLQQVKIDKMAIFNSDEFIIAMKKMQEEWFETMDADYDGQRLIFRNPKPEIIERYYKWKAKKRLKNGKLIKIPRS